MVRGPDLHRQYKDSCINMKVETLVNDRQSLNLRQDGRLVHARRQIQQLHADRRYLS